MTLVRWGVITDLPFLVALENEAFATDRITEDEFRHNLQHPHDGPLLIVAQHEQGAILGYAQVLFRISYIWLSSIATYAVHQRQGVAKALLDFIESQATGRKITLECRFDNKAAIEFYRKRGYVQGADIQNYYEDGALAFSFTKPPTPYRPETDKITATRDRLNDILRRHVKAEDHNLIDDLLVRIVVARYEKERGVYILDPSE